MNWKNLAFAAVAYAAIGQVIHVLGAMLDMGYYTNPAYASVWSPIMMPGPAPPPAEFYGISILAALVMGAIFAFGFTLVGNALASKKSFRADRAEMLGAKYGLFVFALAGLSSLTMPLLFNVPFGLALSWTLQSLAVCVLAGAATGRLMSRK